MSRLPLLAVVCCAAALLLGACSEKNRSAGGDASSGAGKLRVLATFAPIFSFTKNVAGEAAEVEMLLPPNAEPHDFALAPSDLKKIADADVLVQNGMGLEAWLDHAVEGGMKAGALRIVAAKGIAPLQNPEDRAADESGPNPHVWLDPMLAIKETENIRDGLLARYRSHAETYRANASAFISRLQNLDDEIRRATADLPGRRMLTFHDSFPYFAARYGFEIAGVVEAFPGKEPTPRDVQRLRETIQRKKVRVLFSEPFGSPQILQSLSADLKLPIVVIDPMETGEPGADFYERVMRENLKSMRNALQ